MSEKILIVDDDIDSLKLIGLMLQRNHYEVIAASAGQQALAKAKSERPDLIILDVMMPDMNGYEVSRRLRADPDTQAIPIIMFTAKTLIDDKVAGFEAGADDYLTKPTHPAELASRVKSILERSASRRQGNEGGSKILGVLGVKGGIGTSTVALNLGAAFTNTGHKPIVADFRLGAGSLGLMLGISGKASIADIVTRHPNDINPTLIENALVSHSSGIKLLLSSINPREMRQHYTVDSVFALLNHLRNLASPVILDLGAGYSNLVNRIKDELDEMILLVEPSHIGVSMAQAMLPELDDSKLEIVVANRYKADSGQILWQNVESALEREIRAIISAAPEAVHQAVEAGKPLINYDPSSAISGQIVKLADIISQKLQA